MAASHPRKSSRPIAPVGNLRISRYDQVAGMLLSTLMVLGVVTLLMFLVWLSGRLFWVTPGVPVMVLEDVGGGGSGQVLGSEQQFEEPTPQEVQPQPVAQISVEQTLQSVSTVVAAKAQELDTVYGSASLGSG